MARARIRSSSTRTMKGIFNSLLKKIPDPSFESLGLITMGVGLGASIKSMITQAMLSGTLNEPVNLLERTETMNFGLVTGSIGIVAFAIGSIIDDRIERKELEKKFNESFKQFKEDLLSDERPDMVLFFSGAGARINKRRELQGKDTIPELDKFYEAVREFNKANNGYDGIMDNKEIQKLLDVAQDAIVSQNLIDQYREESLKNSAPRYTKSLWNDPSFGR